MSPKFEDEVAEILSIRMSFCPNVGPTNLLLCIALEGSFTLLLKGGSPSAFRSEKINAFSVAPNFLLPFLGDSETRKNHLLYFKFDQREMAYLNEK